MEPSCTFEEEVRTAELNGRWTESLRAHVQTCPYCSGTVELVRLFRVAQQADLANARVPGFKALEAMVAWEKRSLAEQRRKRKAVFLRMAASLSILTMLGLLIQTTGSQSGFRFDHPFLGPVALGLFLWVLMTNRWFNYLPIRKAMT